MTTNKSVKPEDLTPEQADMILEAFANVTATIVPVLESVAQALKPVIEAYNSLPDELKRDLAVRQVGAELKEATEAFKPEQSDANKEA